MLPLLKRIDKMKDITKEKPPKIGRYLTYNPTSAFNNFTCSDWCGDAWETDIFNNHKKYVIPRTFITHWDYLPEEPILV